MSLKPRSSAMITMMLGRESVREALGGGPANAAEPASALIRVALPSAAAPRKSRRVRDMFSIMAVMPQRESMVAPQAGLPPQTASRLADLESALGSVIRGKAEVVRLSLVCLLARGHLLIE